MPVKNDFHLHTHYLGCADDTMTIPAILQRGQELGLEALAITDHLREVGELELHGRIKEELLESDIRLTIYFGAEIDVNPGLLETLQGDGRLLGDYKKQAGFQFLIGGPHKAYGLGEDDPQQVLRNQHEYHLQTCRIPEFDVLVHPYWFGKSDLETMEWIDDHVPIPRAWTLELGDVAVETGTAIEINSEAILNNGRYSDAFREAYLEFMSLLAAQGVRFSLASDAHTLEGMTVSSLQDFVGQLDLDPDQIWCPPVHDLREIHGASD